MAQFRIWLRAVIPSERGQDLAEYAMLIALVALVVVAAVTALGTNIQGVFAHVADKLPTPAPTASAGG